MGTRSISSIFLLSGLYGFACSAPPSPVEAPAAVHQHAEPHEHAEPDEHHAAPPTTAQAAAAGLTRIDTGSVCMLSNRYLGDRPQVPVAVEGKTYYGCCANCAARLAERPDAREARDPITGHTVDKGSAILARDAQNRVLYFESEATLARMQSAAISGAVAPSGQNL